MLQDGILHGQSVFSKLYLAMAYRKIPFAPDDITKTAANTSFGLYKYVVMSLGPRNASKSFLRYIFRALGDLEFVFAYIDILFPSASYEEHTKQLKIVFNVSRIPLFISMLASESSTGRK